MKPLLLSLMIFLLAKNLNAQISLSSLNDFEDGTTMGWGVGFQAVTPPVNVNTGGPNGVDDNFLRLVSLGGSGPSSRLIIFSSDADWTGNWTAAGVNFISFKANNLGTSDLTLRITLNGQGGAFSTTNGVLVPAGSGWMNVNIAVSPSDFSSVGGTNLTNTLADVTEIRILHSQFPSVIGGQVAATLGIDVISARSTPLPVRLEYFTVTTDKTKSNIQWKTLEESNSSHFDVERSVNSTDWHLLERVPAAGHSTIPVIYSVQDFFPQQGVSFYRLKQVDIDGRYTYSAVVSTIFNGRAADNIIISSNPGNGVFMLILPPQQNNSSVIVEVFDSRGSQVYSRSQNVNTSRILLDLKKQAKGWYFVRVRSEDNAWTKRLIIQ